LADTLPPPRKTPRLRGRARSRRGTDQSGASESEIGEWGDYSSDEWQPRRREEEEEGKSEGEERESQGEEGEEGGDQRRPTRQSTAAAAAAAVTEAQASTVERKHNTRSLSSTQEENILVPGYRLVPDYDKVMAAIPPVVPEGVDIRDYVGEKRKEKKREEEEEKGEGGEMEDMSDERFGRLNRMSNQLYLSHRQAAGESLRELMRRQEKEEYWLLTGRKLRYMQRHQSTRRSKNPNSPCSPMADSKPTQSDCVARGSLRTK
jgi:hypothetical protein